ncbi:MAG TPA: hypothetical protein VFN96_06975 [Gemmatimonadales bacterium]|nr:hypothetical protein [Gemmatimonadales bacterium]
MTEPGRRDWSGRILGLLAVGAVAWFYFARRAVPGSSDASWAAPLAIYLAGVAGVLLYRRLRRDPGRAGITTGEMNAERLAEVESRLDQLEAVQARVAELEERLDFAERLLARGEAVSEREPG